MPISARPDALRSDVVKRMITRLIMAQLIPVAIKLITKAFRKKKQAPDPHLDGQQDQHRLDDLDQRRD